MQKSIKDYHCLLFRSNFDLANGDNVFTVLSVILNKVALEAGLSWVVNIISMGCLVLILFIYVAV